MKDERSRLGMRNRWLSAAVAAALAIGVTACGGTPGQDAPKTAQQDDARAQVKTDGFGKLGPVTLRVVATPAPGPPRDAMLELNKQFEAKYPNVNVQISFRDASWWKQALLVMSGDNPPDVAQGNQGYSLDGPLVKAGLILPLDEYVKAYGWDESFSDEALQQFEWSPDGLQFGTGSVYGIAQAGQAVGVYANLAKLREAGVDPTSLKTFDDFDRALTKVKASLPADEPVIMLGNKEGDVNFVWGALAGVYSSAQEARDFIFHRPGQTFDNEGNRQALEKLEQWNDTGYFGPGDVYSGRSGFEATQLFAHGEGAFLIEGNWYAETVAEGLKDDAAFFVLPPGVSGKVSTEGGTGEPFHISTETKNPDLAAAYINFVAARPASKALVETTQVPAIVDPTAEPSTRFGREVAQAWQELIKAGGLRLFVGWSSPTIFETLVQSEQEMLAGRASVSDVLTRVQDDWAAYDEELKELGGE